MERCPNCGAPTRPGAKFCTTCGYRLTMGADDAPTAGDVAPASDLAAEDRPVPAASNGPLAPARADADDDRPAVVDTADEEGIADEPEPAIADQVISSSWPTPDASPWSVGWGAPRETEAPAPLDEAAATAYPASDPDPDPDDGDQAPVSWAVGAWGARTDAPADPVDIGPDPGALLPAAAPSGVEADAPPPVDAVDGLDAADPFLPAGDERQAPPLPDTVGDAAERAAALVEELRALLPALTAGPELDAEAVAVDLQAALPTDAGAAASDRELLRAALRAVRDRPRDIDAMLDLAVRADPLLALLDEHDAALAAIDRAVAALVPDRG